jgi:hypothetical protein
MGVLTMKFRLSGAFGELAPVRNHAHNGIDIPLPVGTELRSITDGVVERVVDYGNHNIGKGVIIRTDDGNFHIFGHMKEITVHKGQVVHEGSFLGVSGNTGHSTGPHLHFGIQAPDGHFIDPTSQFGHVTSLVGDIKPHGLLSKLTENSPADIFMDHLAKDFGHWFADKLHDFHVWFTFALPDIMGYVTLCSALGIMLFSMFNTKWVKRTIGLYCASLIGSFMYLTYY